jgi:endonuclease G, mitochondrial
MASRSRSLPLPIIVGIILVLGIYLWRQHQRAVQENANRAAAQQGDHGSGGAPSGPSAPTSAGDNAALGMPTPASDRSPDDYLISKPQYVLSYNKSRSMPNWVEWHLSAADLGPVERGQFAPDMSLPKGWARITPNDYRNIGFDRGHMCPSGDRTASKQDNDQTFLMTNIVPQAADNNQGPWAHLEDYCRDLVRQGNELYITCGVAGPFTPTSNSKLSSPASTWKVILVLSEGSDDLSRITPKTRVIAVVMPNQNGIRDRDWRSFRTSVADVERATGYTFFGNLPAATRQAIEARVDSE